MNLKIRTELFQKSLYFVAAAFIVLLLAHDAKADDTADLSDYSVSETTNMESDSSDTPTEVAPESYSDDSEGFAE
jgi:hypothetical protein